WAAASGSSAASGSATAALAALPAEAFGAASLAFDLVSGASATAGAASASSGSAARLAGALALALAPVDAVAPLPSGVTPSAASGLLGISRTLTLPPAPSILARAEAVNASATTKSGTDRSPAP